MTARGLPNGKYQGMHWIRPCKRLAIYLRDGLTCVYCQTPPTAGWASLTLDHLDPHSNGGANRPSNLVTCCRRCNSSRGNRSVSVFCRAVAEYLNTDAAELEERVWEAARRPPHDELAKALMSAQIPFKMLLSSLAHGG